MAQHQEVKQRSLWLDAANVLVHPWGGRLIGLAMVLLPGAIFGFLLWSRGHPLTPLTVAGWSALAVPGFLVAALLHEAGHMLMLMRVGAGARFTWRLPLDMRTVPRREGLRFHTCDRLAKRGLAGFVANLLCWGLLLMGVAATGKLLLAYLGLWQGVSALAATAWVADYPATDAATLRQGVAFRDQLELQTIPGSSATVTIELRVKLSLAPSSAPAREYWIEIRGLSELQLSPGSARPWIFSTSPDEILLLWHTPESGSVLITGSGRPSATEIVCMSKCGTTVFSAV